MFSELSLVPTSMTQQTRYNSDDTSAPTVTAGDPESLTVGQLREPAEECSGQIEIVTESIDRVADNIANLDGTLSPALSVTDSIFSTDVAFAIFIAIIGAFSAYLFNLFHWQFVSKREKISRIGEALLRTTDDLEKLSVHYWTSDCHSSNAEETHATEVLIKSRSRLLAKYVDIYVTKGKFKNNHPRAKKLVLLTCELYDVATGEDFESKKRSASRAKAQKISNMCADITATVAQL